MGNHQENRLEIINHIAHKFMKDTNFYAHIQANNAYYKEVIG
jgi:hypothetical protein